MSRTNDPAKVRQLVTGFIAGLDAALALPTPPPPPPPAHEGDDQ